MRETFELPSDKEMEIIKRISEKDLEEEEIFVPYAESEYAEPTPNALIEMGKTRFHVSGLVHDESGFPNATYETAEKLIKRLTNKVKLHIDEITLYDEYLTEDAEVLVIAYGVVARSAKEAVKIARQDRMRVGLFKPITIWPIPVHELKKRLSKVEAVVIPEMNLGQYGREILKLIKPSTKVKFINKVGGELITPEEILDGINEVLTEGFDF